jgi:hypothetical protein
MLNYRQLTFYTFEYKVLLTFDTFGFYIFVGDESGKQFTVAATGIKDLAVGFDQL